VAEPDAAGAGTGDLTANTGSNLADSGGNGSGTVAAVEDATGAVPTAASAAAAASGVTSLAGAARALSDEFISLQHLVGYQRATDIKNEHQQWESNVAKLQVPFEAVMNHPAVQAFAGKVGTCDA